MPFNGSGVFTRLYSWIADAAGGIDITASRMDGDTNDIVSNGLGNCLTRDGQGSATANIPMNGYKFTGVGSGSAATDLIAVGQLTPTGNAAAIGVTGIGAVGDIKPTALPAAVLPTGWYVCAGQTRPRTDPLWLATGAINAAYWVFGNGDGSTTYTLPDFRGRGLFGKDDMGGTAANRITGAVSGITGTTLGAVGGDQHAQAPGVTVNINTGTQSGSISASSTSTSVVTDPTHAHALPNVWYSSGAGSNGVPTTTGTSTTNTTGAEATGITVSTTTTTVISDSRVLVGSSNLSGSSQNMPPAAIVNMIIFCGA